MSLIDSKDSQIFFDVEKNAQFALPMLEAYFSTPDVAGKVYASIPDFFLVKPHTLEAMQLSMPRHEEQLLLTTKLQALERHGYIGVTKYFDEELGHHWIKFSPFPFCLGDVVSKNQAEFYALLIRFIRFTKNNKSIYGNLTSPGEDYSEMRALLRDIEVRAAHLDEKLQRYSEAQLLSYDPLWPRTEVRKLLDILKSVDQDGHRVLTEYLRQTMRKQAGVGQKMRALVQTQDRSQNSLSGVDLSANSAPSPRQLGAGVLELATARSTHLAKISEETRYKALKAEEEKIRLEALAIVAARKQILASEEASREALERIEQIRQIRIAEELRLNVMEQQQLESERLAADALAQRLVLAGQASATAQQRHLAEVRLLQKVQADISAQTDIANLSAQSAVANTEKRPEVGGQDQKSDSTVSELHRGIRDQDAEPALITLDFKALHQPKALLDLGAAEVSRHDSFADKERLLAQHESLATVGVQLTKGQGLLRSKNLWRFPLSFVARSAIVILFMLIALIGGRYWLFLQQTPLQSAKVQPIFYVPATAKPSSMVNGVLAADVALDKREEGVMMEPIPLKMSDHLSP